MKQYTYDNKKWFTVQPDEVIPSLAVSIREIPDLPNLNGELMDWFLVTKSILTLQQTVSELQAMHADLQDKLDSLARSFELYQEVAGIEILAEPVARYWGVCIECERHGQVQESSGLCEGCTLDKQLPRL